MRELLEVVAENPPQRDYVTLGGQILIAMIGAFALIVVAWFQFVYRPGKKSQDSVLEKVRHQVENSHPTNMRDDIDEVATDVKAIAMTVRTLVESLTVVHDEITTVRDDTSGLHRAVAGLRQEVTQLRNE